MALNIKIIDYKKIDETYNNYLELEISGDEINHVIINTLRRVILELVPMYAYNRSNIIITKNESIYNNDQLTLRISQFPIFDIDNEISNINKVFDLEKDANLIHYNKKDELIINNIDNSLNFSMYVNVTNTTNKIINVTTDNEFASFKYKGNTVESPYKRKLLITKLKPNEKLILTAISNLHIGLKNSIYFPGNCFYSKSDKEKNTYIFNVESNKQLSEKEIISRACQIIINKLDNFLEIIIEKINEYKSDNNIHFINGIIKIENESYTFGNLISRFLQDHLNIKGAAYKIEHLLIRELEIKYETDDTLIIDIINDVINSSKNVYKNLKKKIDQLNLDKFKP